MTRMFKHLLSVILAGVVCAHGAFAAPSACDNPAYRRANPTRCSALGRGSSFKSTLMWTGGAVAAASGVALVAMALGGSGGGGSATAGAPVDTDVSVPEAALPPVMPTLHIYDTVGYTNPELLAAVRRTRGYQANSAQYDTMRAAYSLARGYTGKNSIIALLDTDQVGWHGTAVRNIAGGTIAPDVTLHSHQIVDATGEFLAYDRIAQIIASDQSAHIFNASWGVESQARLNAATINTRAQMTRLTSATFVDEITRAAQDRDAIFVWAAGNEGRSQSTAMAALPRVVPELDGHFINVVAWDNNTGALADYSNACGVTKMYCITAPGTDLNVGIGTASGTSFAAPAVSAAVAVIREAFPYMTASEITELIFTTARDLGASGVDDVYGWGMLDLERATRPVGATLVAVDGNMMQPLRTARAAGVIGRQLKSANLKFAFFDSFGRAFDANLNDNIKFRPMGRGYERLRGHDDDIAVQLGGLEFGITRGNLLASDGFLRTGGREMMGFVGIQDQLTIGDARVFHRTRVGFTTPKAADDSMITGFSNIVSATTTIGATLGDWTLTLGVPDTIVSGDMTVRLATGRSRDGRILYRNHRLSLVEQRPAVELTAQYKFITAGYINNPGDTDEVYIMAKTRIQF